MKEVRKMRTATDFSGFRNLWLSPFFAALFLCLSSLAAQTNNLSLTGNVFDTSAKPISSAHVRLEQPTEQRVWEAETTPDGTFRFDRLAFGTYRITVQLQGYFETSSEVRLESSKTVEFTLAATERVTQ